MFHFYISMADTFHTFLVHPPLYTIYFCCSKTAKISCTIECYVAAVFLYSWVDREWFSGHWSLCRGTTCWKSMLIIYMYVVTNLNKSNHESFAIVNTVWIVKGFWHRSKYHKALLLRLNNSNLLWYTILPVD